MTSSVLFNHPHSCIWDKIAIFGRKIYTWKMNAITFFRKGQEYAEFHKHQIRIKWHQIKSVFLVFPLLSNLFTRTNRVWQVRRNQIWTAINWISWVPNSPFGSLSLFCEWDCTSQPAWRIRYKFLCINLCWCGHLCSISDNDSSKCILLLANSSRDTASGEKHSLCAGARTKIIKGERGTDEILWRRTKSAQR